MRALAAVRAGVAGTTGAALRLVEVDADVDAPAPGCDGEAAAWQPETTPTRTTSAAMTRSRTVRLTDST